MELQLVLEECVIGKKLALVKYNLKFNNNILIKKYKMKLLDLFEIHVFVQNLQLIKLISSEEDIDYKLLLNILKDIYKK